MLLEINSQSVQHIDFVENFNNKISSERFVKI